MFSKTCRLLQLLLVWCMVLFPLRGIAAPETPTFPTSSPSKQSSPVQLKSPPTRTFKKPPPMRAPTPAIQYGYCCVDGKVAKSDAVSCSRKRGQFFRNQRSAQKGCDAQQGFCCKNGKLTKSSRGSCASIKGDFSVNPTKAKKSCDNTRGFCCSEGRVASDTKGGCDRKKGSFFMTRPLADQQCAKQKGYCCKEGSVARTVQGACKKQGGRFFISQRDADQACTKQKGYCCKDGSVARTVQGSCKKQGGRFFISQRDADQTCAKQKGYCCRKGRVSQSVQGTCKKQRGEFFISKREAAQSCDSQKGYCCDDNKVLPTSQGVCKKQKGEFYLQKQQADRKCKDEQGSCLVNSRLVPNKTKDECRRLGGTFRLNPQTQYSRQISQQLKGFCCVDEKLRPNKTEAECKRLKGSFSIRRDVAADSCRAGKAPKTVATAASGNKANLKNPKGTPTPISRTNLKSPAAVQGKELRLQQTGKTTRAPQTVGTKKLTLQKPGSLSGAPKSKVLESKVFQNPGKKSVVTGALSGQKADLQKPGGKVVDPRLLNPELVRLRKIFKKPVDPDSYLVKKLQKQPLISKGATSKFSKRTVEAGKGATRTIGEIADSVFKKQDEFQQNMAKIKPASGLILKPPETRSETYEFKDSFVLKRETGVVVVKPEELAKKSPEFARFLGSAKRQRVAFSSLSPKSQERLQDFIKNKLPNRPDDDPVKIASKDGAQAVLDAIREGKGPFKIVEEVFVPKNRPPVISKIVQEQGVAGGAYLNIPDKGDLASTFDPHLNIDTPGILSEVADDDEPAPSSRMSQVDRGMMELFEEQFMTGFTIEDRYHFRKTWDLDDIGFFRVEAGAGYTIGLRFPIQVRGEVSPNRINVTGPNDVTTSFESRITVTTVDADCTFFSDVGLGGEACGKELALDAYVYYGVKFRFLGENVVNHYPPRFYILPYSKDFVPPYNNNGGGVPIWIPPNLTYTEVGIGGIVDGAVEVGFKISGNGKVSFDYESRYGNTRANRALTFRTSAPVVTSTTIEPMAEGTEGTALRQNYGFKLYNPKYIVTPKIVPGVRAHLTVGYSWFSRTFAISPWWLESLSLLFPEISFSRHDGTTRQYRWMGEKTFTPR